MLCAFTRFVERMLKSFFFQRIRNLSCTVDRKRYLAKDRISCSYLVKDDLSSDMPMAIYRMSSATSQRTVDYKNQSWQIILMNLYAYSCKESYFCPV